MSLIDKQKTYEVLSDYYHHSTEQQHKALREALDRVPSESDKDINVPNTDCISRKKTLERLTNISYNLCKTEAEDKIIEYAKTMVITMPSAQPKTQLSKEDATKDATSDTISRQAAIDIVRNRVKRFTTACVLAVTEIEQLPSAQPEASQVARDIATIIENERDMRVISERNTGRWIGKHAQLGTCSECGYRTSLWKYCPNCGCRKMEVEHDRN